MRGRGPGRSAAVAEVPGVGQDRAVRVRGARAVDGHDEIGRGLREGRGRRRVGRDVLPEPEVVLDRCRADGAAVNGDLVDSGVHVGARRPPGRVAADPPVAVVCLGGCRRVRPGELPVDVESQARRRLSGDDVVPLAVRVARGRRDGVRLAGIRAEDDLAVVLQVDMAVVGGGGPRLVSSESDQLSPPVRCRVEPQFERVRLRIIELLRAGDETVVSAEGGGGVRRAGYRSGAALGDVTGVDAGVVGTHRVRRNGAGALTQAPVEVGRVAEDSGTIGIGWRGGDGGGAA